MKEQNGYEEMRKGKYGLGAFTDYGNHFILVKSSQLVISWK
jgi:hypothetical protein